MNSVVRYTGPPWAERTEEKGSMLFFDSTIGAVLCSDCWDYYPYASDDFDHYPYEHAKLCAEAYARYDDDDKATEFRLSVRTAVIVDGAPLEESALVAAAQEVYEKVDRELYPIRYPAEDAGC